MTVLRCGFERNSCLRTKLILYDKIWLLSNAVVQNSSHNDMCYRKHGMFLCAITMNLYFLSYLAKPDLIETNIQIGRYLQWYIFQLWSLTRIVEMLCHWKYIVPRIFISVFVVRFNSSTFVTQTCRRTFPLGFKNSRTVLVNYECR